MVLRWLVLGLTLAAIIIWLVYLLKCKKKWLYALAPLLWLVNVGAFWVYRLFLYQIGSNIELVNEWSVGIYFHAMITLTGAGIVAIGESKRC